MIIFAAHITACGFYGIGKLEHFNFHNEDNWLVSNEMINEHILESYSKAFFWSCGLFVSAVIFYPITTLERVY